MVSLLCWPTTGHVGYCGVWLKRQWESTGENWFVLYQKISTANSFLVPAIVCFDLCLNFFCFNWKKERERAWIWIHRKEGRIWEEFGSGKNLIKIYYMKIIFKKWVGRRYIRRLRRVTDRVWGIQMNESLQSQVEIIGPY